MSSGARSGARWAARELDTALLSLTPSKPVGGADGTSIESVGAGGLPNIAHLRAFWAEAHNAKLGETPASYKLLWELARLHKTRLPL